MHLAFDLNLPTAEAPVDLDRWRELIGDSEIWNLADITRELRLNRTTTHRLRIASRNVAEGRTLAWPPSGPEREKLQPVLGTVPEIWWTDCASALPNADFPDVAAPRWYAGTVRRWAMRTGRMALDGTPTPPPIPGTRPRDRTPTPVDVDTDRVRTLWADTTLWAPNDIAAALAVDVELARAWARVAANYTVQGCTEWPPPAHGRVIAKARSGPRLSDWPEHGRTLPPPDEIITIAMAGRRKAAQTQHAIVKPRWYAGKVRRWAMRTGRMALDGTPTPRVTDGG